jgi:hypothetical protein
MPEEIGHISVGEAGKRGGLACLRNKGHAFFVAIGKKGQLAMRHKYPNKASEWGKGGGRPRKLTLNQIVGERSK